ncbi:MAG: hypothetical protein JO088_23475, partial [Acidobacteria bacterium]|nr:hypothetical protein [Acidobacteriota bacterium]
MKRTTAAVGMFLCAVFVLPAIASESFTLNIPVRGNPQQETGEVRITLTLNASPAGSQLVVNGTATLNLGDPRAPLRVDREAKLNGEGRLGGPVDKDQTGTYVFTAAALPANKMPDVAIAVDGVAI